jgi:two-component system response regulator NreC
MSKSDPTTGLTPREQQVACFVAAGYTNHEIARELRISVKTYDSHRGSILKKLKLRGTADLVRFVLRQGWVGLDGRFVENGESGS